VRVLGDDELARLLAAGPAALDEPDRQEA